MRKRKRTMTIGAHRESARIYRFPDRGRTSVRNLREPAEPATETAPQPVVKAAPGSGWYHEAAIEAAEGKLKS
jgi:hypothetical protein